MAPLAPVMMLTLVVLTWFSFPARSIEKHDAPGNQQWQKPLFIVSVLLYVVFIVALELKLTGWALLLVAGCFLLLARRVLVSVDWTLLLVFMAMFIDVHFLMQLPVLQPHFAAIGQLGEGGIYLLAIGLSQFISNVPSTILLLNYVPPSDAAGLGGEYRRVWAAARLAGQPDCPAHGKRPPYLVALPSVFPADACLVDAVRLAVVTAAALTLTHLSAFARRADLSAR